MLQRILIGNKKVTFRALISDRETQVYKWSMRTVFFCQFIVLRIDLRFQTRKNTSSWSGGKIPNDFEL